MDTFHINYRNRKGRIVFVDDEPDYLEALKTMLRPNLSEWDMRFFSSVDETLAGLKNDPADVVVSDVQMPGKSGMDLLKALKTIPDIENVQVIIITGSNERDLKRRSLQMGASDLLNKPIQYEELVARVRNVLQLKRNYDEIKDYNTFLNEKVRERTHQLELARIAVTVHLAKAGEYRDEETGEHIIRVGWYSRILAGYLGKQQEYCDMIALAAPLHDIGKIGIPDFVLLKPGKLNSEEWLIMKRHVAIGHHILNKDFYSASRLMPELDWSSMHKADDYPIMHMAGEIALYHHEKWNGEGYLNGRSGKDIPIEARIVALADVYDALRSERPYKKPFSHEHAVEIIRTERAQHFDPELVDLFLEHENEFSEIYDRLKEQLKCCD